MAEPELTVTDPLTVPLPRMFCPALSVNPVIADTSKMAPLPMMMLVETMVPVAPSFSVPLATVVLPV